MAPTKSNPRRIVRVSETSAQKLSPPKRNSQRLALLKRKDEIVNKMAELFDDVINDVAPLHSLAAAAKPQQNVPVVEESAEAEPSEIRISDCLTEVLLIPFTTPESDPVPVEPVAGPAEPSSGDAELGEADAAEKEDSMLINTEMMAAHLADSLAAGPAHDVPALVDEVSAPGSEVDMVEMPPAAALDTLPPPLPVDLRPPGRVLEQGEIIIPDDPEQIRLLIEHNIKLKGALTDDMLERVNKLLEAISADKCHCCGESIETAHKGGEFPCDQPDCLKTFRLKSSVDRHKRIIHFQGDVHECPQCGARCADKGTLARHMYTHTGLKPYTCEVCNKHFSRKYHLDRHIMQTGCDGKPKAAYPCQVCAKMFTRKDNLREHLRAHAGQVRRQKCYTCPYCEKQMFGATPLQVHLRTHTGERPYQCDFCEKNFPSVGGYKKHRRIHTGEKPYECKHCGARFSAKETLNRHVRTHTGVKPHSCQYCGKAFIQASQLKSHIFHHTGQGGFKCSQCDRSFNRKVRLRMHVEYVHEGKKNFVCHLCEKGFVRKEDLARHEVLHRGTKMHRCPICEKSFAIKPSLKIHLLTHTKEPPRSCEECGRAFIRQDCLLRHMRKKHREMLDQIMADAEKKKIQQQLMSFNSESREDGASSASAGGEELQVSGKGTLSEQALGEALRELLSLLVDDATLQAFGHPQQPVEQVLESVIRRCGHAPTESPTLSHSDRLRENAKLLFTVVIDDNAVKTLLNSQTVDEVILHVLRLAKS